jgi:hypothetical protein
MRKLLLAFLLILPTIVFAQGTATNIRNGSSLPTACANGDIFYKTSGTIGVYECTSPGNPGTWTHVPYTASNIASLFSGCSGAQYLGFDGACHTAVGSPAGSDKYCQFNDGGAFGGESNCQWDKTTHTLTIGSGSTQGIVKLFDGSGHFVGLKSPTSVTSYTWLFPAADASGFLKSDGAGNLSISTPTVTTVNGVSFPSSPATHSVNVITASNTSTAKVIPDCTDTGGNHLNFTQSTDAFSCGTSSSGGGSSGSLVLLCSLTASASSSLSFTSSACGSAPISATYDEYEIHFLSIKAGGTAGQLVLEVSANDGSSYDQTSGHYGEYQMSTGAGSAAADSGTSSALLIFPYTTGRNMSTTANYVAYGKMTFSNPNGGDYKGFKGEFVAPDSVGASPFNLISAGLYLQTGTFNAFRVRHTAGNITGIVRLYGVAH